MKVAVVLERLKETKTMRTYGLAYISRRPVVKIDPRQGQQSMLETAIHEGLHVAFPELTEREVRRAEKIIAQIPWKLGYRRKKK